MTSGGGRDDVGLPASSQGAEELRQSKKILVIKYFYFSICIFSVLDLKYKLQYDTCLYYVPCIHQSSVKIPFDYISGRRLFLYLASALIYVAHLAPAGI